MMESNDHSNNTKGRGSVRAFRLFSILLPLLLLSCFYFVDLPKNKNTQSVAQDIKILDSIISTSNTQVKKDDSMMVRHASCSCWNPSAPRKCCRRVIFRAHKFGTLLTNALFKEYRGPQQPIRTQFYPRFVDENLPTHVDFRHVAVIRNFVDAIVSAYLYHKVGNECWITLHGVHDANMTALWQEYPWKLKFHKKYDIWYPKPRKRSICTYLNEESVQDGMRVLMDFAMTQWYDGVVSYWRKVQRRYRKDRVDRVLFVCYEDLADPFQQEDVFNRMMEWMFSGHDLSNVSMPVDMKESLRQQQANHTAYSGGHASNHDPLLRSRLKNLVKRLDRKMFDNTAAKANKIFQCGDMS